MSDIQDSLDRRETNKPVKGFKYRIYPTEDQKVLLAKTFGSCRFVYNKALASSFQEYEMYITGRELSKDPNSVKSPDTSGYRFVKEIKKYRDDPELHWLKEVSSVALQQSMLDLGGAYNNFFRSLKHTRRVGRPKFKSKHSRQSFRLVNTAFRIKGDELYIAKSKTPIKVIWSRELPSTPSSLTISRTPTNEYYVSFVCEYNPQVTNGQGQVGIDVGLTDFAVLSDGTKIENPKWFVNKQKQLKRAQQNLARKTKDSKNRNKTRLKVAKLHQSITNARNDYLHKLSRTLVNENQVIGVEGLRVANMLKNKHLSKAISDVSWSKFFELLSYKTNESGHTDLVMIGTFYPSSHVCSVTGEKLDRKLKLSERSWKCPHCGKEHDRDVNAAKNILNEAIRLRSQLNPNTLGGRTILLK